MKKTIIVMAIVLALNSLGYAQSQQRVKCGWGASVSASTTPAYIAIEQVPGTNVIVNGTFATTNTWLTNDTFWVISNGYATVESTDSLTSTIAQASLKMLTTGNWYRLTYTLSQLSGANSILPILGTASGSVARTANGTYSDDVYFTGAQQIAFRNIQTGASTASLDNVYLTTKPDAAYAYKSQLFIGTKDPQVFVGINCTGDVFTNMYSASRTMLVDSNRATEIQQGEVPQMAPIRGFWYRTAAGTATLNINAY